MEGTFCFIDIAGFTALTETHGADTAADLIDRFVAITSNALGDHGRIVDRAGDGLFIVVPVAIDALTFVTRLMASTASEVDFPLLRAGLHSGEAIERGGSYFGSDVNLAARVAAKAGGGQVLVTDGLAKIARSALQLEVTSLGMLTLRNILKPVELFALALSSEAESTAVDPVCRMRVLPASAPARLRFEEREFWFCSLDCASRFAAAPALFASSPQ